MSEYPKKIYLQWHGDQPGYDPDGPEPAEVTWSKEPVFDYDIEYVLVDAGCKHIWVDASNMVVSGEWCPKCDAVRATPSEDE